MTNSTNFQLELVQVLFRHGARVYSEAEAVVVPNQYIDSSLHETYGYGHLTNIGKLQAYKLGCNLRDRYQDFLGSTYRPSDVYAYSSDTVRTKMTLMLVLASLYPPSGDQIWKGNLPWSPIPYCFVPKGVDMLLKLYEQPIYKQKIHAAVHSIEGVMDKVKLPEVKEFLENLGFQNITNNLINSTFATYNVLSSHKVANGKLPDWYSDDLLNDLHAYVVFYLDLMSSSRELRRLVGGPLVKRVIQNLNLNSNMANPRKLYLYCGHEINLAAFVRAHKIQNFIYPNFASAVIVEKLRDSQNQLYIRMIGYTGKDDNFYTLKFRDCEDFCPIKTYLGIVEDILPSDEELNLILNQLTDAYHKKRSINTDFVFRPECKH